MRAVLLPGAWHDAHCWTLLQDRLSDQGIDSMAVSFPTDDPAAGLASYAAAARDQAGGIRDSDVIVAHSMGGLVAPLLGGGRLVLVTPLLPRPGVSAREQATTESTFLPAFRAVEHERQADGSSRFPAAAAQEFFYGTCPPHVAEQAVDHLVAQHWAAFIEPSPLQSWPTVPTTVVLARQDQVLSGDAIRQRAREIQAALVEIDADHSPMLSAPRRLAQVITADVATAPH